MTGSSTPEPGSGRPVTYEADTEVATASDEQAAADSRYSHLYNPIGGAFTQLAVMAAMIFNDAEFVSVDIGNDARLWFPRSVGDRFPAGPGLTRRAGLPGELIAINDTSRDARTSTHPWVADRPGIRFLAAAPIVADHGFQVGTVEVLDRQRRRRVEPSQLTLLGGVAATIAQLLDLRVASLAALRAERSDRADENTARDDADRRRDQLSQAATATRDREQPQWCQLGGAQGCTAEAQLKIADSWGEGAWGCWQHAEEALTLIPSTFLATESTPDLAAFRQRSDSAG